MQLINKLLTAILVSALVACGGGGGNASGPTGTTTTTGVTPGTSVNGDSQTSATATMNLDVLSGSGVSTNTISAIEISKIQIVLKDKTGAAVGGAVVKFYESGGSLLSFAPVSKTALTDASGVASVEVRALSAASVGATTVTASATVSNVAITSQKAIAITSAPVVAGVTPDPQALANAVNFLDVIPSDKSIVLAGAGGNGRSESATLRFRVVDKNNTPVKGAIVTFVVVPSSDVTLNIASATSDADGVVVTTVSSKTVATAVVIKATVTRTGGSTIISQSDQLLVTTGISTQAGFDLSASKYNLNSGITGDSSAITVRIVDANGNRVADGVPVVFTTPYGAVGTSSRGGCVTLNGACSVDYIVQNPRPLDGVSVVVTASTQLGTGTSITGNLQLNVVNPSLLDLFDARTGGATVFDFSFAPGECAMKTFTAYAGTPANLPAPAGTTVSLTPITSGLAVALKSGSPILDQLTSPALRTLVDIEVDLTSMVGLNRCSTTGTTPRTANFEVKFTAGTISKTPTPRITVNYFAP
jgi:protocatechuate 3,4-dioxygenase beta subunit